MQNCLQIIVWQSFIATCIILGNMAMQLRKYGQGLPRISCTSVGVACAYFEEQAILDVSASLVLGSGTDCDRCPGSLTIC